jgi:lysophospholipase L1-like esterase
MVKQLDTTVREWRLSAAMAIALVASMTIPAIAGDPPDDKEIGLLAKEGPPVRIMPLGDSITYDNRRKDMRPTGVRIAYRRTLHDLLKSAGYAFDFVGSENAGERYLGTEMDDNAGFPGITDEQLAVLIKTGYSEKTSTQLTPGPYLETHPADIILLHIGTNGVEESADGVEQILDNIRACDPDVYIIVARIINRYPYHDVTTTFNDNVEAMVKARDDSRIVMVDMENGAGIDYYTDMDDDLHPNYLGYDKMAAVWFKALIGLKAMP